MTSLRLPFNPDLLARLLIFLAILLVIVAGVSTAVAPAVALTQAAAHAAQATHTRLVVGPRLPCPGLSLPC